MYPVCSDWHQPKDTSLIQDIGHAEQRKRRAQSPRPSVRADRLEILQQGAI